MQIAYHIGANCTDEERLLKSILKNVDTLLQRGIVVPGPGKYRRLLRETIQGLDGAPPRPGTRDILIDAIVEEDSVTRVVLSNDNFIAIPKRIFDHGIFYPQTEDKVGTLARLFPQDDLTLMMGMRHPASFLQEIARRVETPRLTDLIGGMSPLDLRWSDVVDRIRQAAPDARICVWCNEDTPLIWEDLMRVQTGLAADVPLEGCFDMLATIITREGLAQLQTQMEQSPPSDRIARHEMIAAAIEAYANPAAMEDEIALPELADAALIDALDDSYDEDVEILCAMDGVEVILPFT